MSSRFPLPRAFGKGLWSRATSTWNLRTHPVAVATRGSCRSSHHLEVHWPVISRVLSRLKRSFRASIGFGFRIVLSRVLCPRIWVVILVTLLITHEAVYLQLRYRRTGL